MAYNADQPKNRPTSPSFLNRREFITITGGSAALLSMSATPAKGQSLPSPEDLYARLIPGKKDLNADWLASLVSRGHRLDAAISHKGSDVDLEVIGMTVGGIGCGTVYLSGDGQLWIWDIFNSQHEGVVANRDTPIPEGLDNIGKNKILRERDGSNFVRPPRARDHKNGVDAHFRLQHGEREFPLDASGWKNVSFTGQWPMGTVRYTSPETPLKVELEAYSPFIPLNLKDSSLPLTVLEYKIENPTDHSQKATLLGHLNNPAGQRSGLEALRFTETFSGNNFSGLYHGLRAEGPNKNEVSAKADFGSMALITLNESGASIDPATHTLSIPLSIPAKTKRLVKFAITWHFPNIKHKHYPEGTRRHYVRQFKSAREVATHFAKSHDRLDHLTRKWVATWNNSTLPQWLLDRTILPTNTLQTQTCFLFENGQFWAWEGIGCCPGTCGHVWQYAQGHARLFPETERILREKTDYGPALNPDGSIDFRGTNNNMAAIDAQAAYVLRTLRDLQLSDDPDYFKRVWEPTKEAIRYLIEFDRQDERGGLDGLLDGKQHNTLDAEWYGKVHVLCSMYLAALRAAEEMALSMSETILATELRNIFEQGRKNIEKLYNGEYYEQIEDPAHLDKIGVGKGCYIDQVMGQFWANQVGLGRLYNPEHQKSALRALWKYNFVVEYGAFRKEFKKGRHYAGPGDSGLLMCTWPKGGLRDDFTKHWQYSYFNEFMTGFEYQAAAHMVAERDADLVQNGLAITRAIHDRYSAKRGRNPYNEIECSDHYSRAGSAYAVFLATCGFEFDQSKGRLAFDPVIQKENFRAPFTTSEAWGTYEQKGGTATITITHGKLTLNQLDLGIFKDKEIKATLNRKPTDIKNLTLKENDVLELEPA
jgi:non-lysosomal glucosylceramidase